MYCTFVLRFFHRCWMDRDREDLENHKSPPPHPHFSPRLTQPVPYLLLTSGTTPRMSCRQTCKITGSLLLLLTLGLAVWLLGCDALHLPKLAFLKGDDPICVRPRLFLMRFFRDLSRLKARKRLHTESSLVTLLMGQEEMLTVRDHEHSGDGTSFTMTSEELSEMDGQEGRPIYLAIRGRIYDVSNGRNFYGHGRSYHHFVARDASRAFATNCKQPACLVASLKGLSTEDQKEIDRWVELYEFHDKYTYVGKLVQGNPVDDAVEQAIREEQILVDIQRTATDTNVDVVDELIRHGKEAYRNADMELAVFMWSAGLTKLGTRTESGGGGGGVAAAVDGMNGVNGMNDGVDSGGSGGSATIWAEAMMKRAQLLGYVAAAVQKRNPSEAMEHFSEAAASMAAVVEWKGGGLAPCLLSKAWFMKANSEADRAAVAVMAARRESKRREGKAREGERREETENHSVRYCRQTLETYVQAHAAALQCTGNKRTESVRVGWMNTQLHLAHALNSLGQYQDAVRSLGYLLGRDEGDTSVLPAPPVFGSITKKDQENSKPMASLYKRATRLKTRLDQEMVLSVVEEGGRGDGSSGASGAQDEL